MERSLLGRKCTLVPSTFFDPATVREALASVCTLDDSEEVAFKAVPDYDAYLIYVSGGDDALPEMFYILEGLAKCSEYNKILCSWVGGCLYMAIAQGRTLLLSNVYEAPDFTTAEYFIFLAMKSLQLNPEVSTICWRLPIGGEEEMSLYRYFKSVDVLCE